MLIEPIYTLVDRGEIDEAILRHTIKKAQLCNADLAITTNQEELADSGAPLTSNMLGRIQGLARELGLKIDIEDVSIDMPQSMSSNEYSDSLGGKITYFQPVRRKLAIVKIHAVETMVATPE